MVICHYPHSKLKFLFKDCFEEKFISISPFLYLMIRVNTDLFLKLSKFHSLFKKFCY